MMVEEKALACVKATDFSHLISRECEIKYVEILFHTLDMH